jgi:hypothetical protein
MTKVFHLASPRAGIRIRVGTARHVQTFTQPTARAIEAVLAGHKLELEPGPVERQAAIENALIMALYFVRQPGNTAANVWAATARANRALTLLKQASQGKGAPSPTNASCNSFGRA